MVVTISLRLVRRTLRMRRDAPNHYRWAALSSGLLYGWPRLLHGWPR
jgi:hypothetical protein